MSRYFNPNYPSISELKRKAKRRIPKLVFDYLEGGCHDELAVERNRADIFLRWLGPLSDEHRKAILGGSAIEFYGLEMS